VPRKKKRKYIKLTKNTEVAAARVPRIRETKLGREGNWGQHWLGTSRIDIDPRQNAKNYLDTLIHEMLHLFFVDLNEDTVKLITKRLVDVIWSKHYRRLASKRK